VQIVEQVSERNRIGAARHSRYDARSPAREPVPMDELANALEKDHGNC
jgi:hypothetical protein